MATVILARHGRTSANATGVLAGRSAGVHLDRAGKDHAAAAAQRLSGLNLAAVVSSPMVRCKETARLLVADRVPVLEPRLTECDYGDWTGRKLTELAKLKLWREVQSQPSAVVFPNGESMAAMAARSVAAIRDHDRAVEAEHGPDAVWLAVTHGDLVKAILADALGTHLDQFQRIVIDPASLSVIRYTPTRPFVLASNSHAGSLAYLGRSAVSRRQRARSRTTDAVPGGGAGPERTDSPAGQ